MFEHLRPLAVLVASLILGLLPLWSHDRYLLPSHTVLSGETGQSVGFEASISNDIFHPDRPLGDNGSGKVSPSLQGFFATIQPQILQPDGKPLNQAFVQAFARFSAGDFTLQESGTYRFSLPQPNLIMTTFKQSDGTSGRRFGTAPEVPEGATEVKTTQIYSRVETFVTLNKPTWEAWNPTGAGLELSGKSHPNDLFAGEAYPFQLFFNGKPLSAACEVTLIQGATRHRNVRNDQVFTTQADGQFEVKFDQAGYYLLKATLQLPGDPATGIDAQTASLFVTLEVFPE